MFRCLASGLRWASGFLLLIFLFSFFFSFLASTPYSYALRRHGTAFCGGRSRIVYFYFYFFSFVMAISFVVSFVLFRFVFLRRISCTAVYMFERISRL